VALLSKKNEARIVVLKLSVLPWSTHEKCHHRMFGVSGQSPDRSFWDRDSVLAVDTKHFLSALPLIGKPREAIGLGFQRGTLWRARCLRNAAGVL